MADDTQPTQPAPPSFQPQNVETPMIVIERQISSGPAHPPPQILPQPVTPPTGINLNTYLLLILIGLFLGFLAFWLGTMVW